MTIAELEWPHNAVPVMPAPAGADAESPDLNAIAARQVRAVRAAVDDGNRTVVVTATQAVAVALSVAARECEAAGDGRPECVLLMTCRSADPADRAAVVVVAFPAGAAGDERADRFLAHFGGEPGTRVAVIEPDAAGLARFFEAWLNNDIRSDPPQRLADLADPTEEE